jgi:hypothetical protein
MKPIIEKDVPKVVQAIRQTQSRKVLYKLLTRIKVRVLLPFCVRRLSTRLDNKRSGGSQTNYALAWIQSHDEPT